MYFEEYLKQFENKKIKIFVDMDGTIVDYVVGDACNFAGRRPLLSSIKNLETVSKKDNIELFILSVTRVDTGIQEKQEWLDQYVPFIPKENRIILARESNHFMTSSELKSKYLSELSRDESILILIDDDPNVLKQVGETSQDIVRLKDTALVD